jgi:hypothetical protein
MYATTEYVFDVLRRSSELPPTNWQLVHTKAGVTDLGTQIPAV